LEKDNHKTIALFIVYEGPHAVPKSWLISDRTVDRKAKTFGNDRGSMTFWISDGGSLDQFESWKEVTEANFKRLLVAASGQLRLVRDPGEHEKQQHVALFIHGYNNAWQEEARRYQTLCDTLFKGNPGDPDDMGICIWFDWPSKGSALGYLPDRRDVRECTPDLVDVLDQFYDWLVDKQADAVAAANDPSNTALQEKVCRAKTSIVAHSMGNYLVQLAMYQLWLRKNKPLLVSLVNQLLMVAADVDNDLFDDGETVSNTGGEGIANLTYRVTALYSGLDAVLGVSAGLKHFGKRRLGRSGLNDPSRVPDNVWATDCTTLFAGGLEFPPAQVHGAYFDPHAGAKIFELMRQVLRGVDRGVLIQTGIAPQPAAG
jgi:esterase/lipase superfamily enzyme